MKKLLLVFALLSSLSLPALERSKEYFNNIAATVRIRTDGGAVGTGTAISKRHVLTAGHVANGESGFTVEFFNDEGVLLKSIRAETEKFEEDGIFSHDLGLLKLSEDAPAMVKVKLGKDRIGDEGYTLGAPLGVKPRHIVIGNFGGPHDWLPMRVLSVVTAPGASGSAVYNDKHELVGVLVSGEQALLVYFIPVDAVESFLKDVKFKVKK